MHQPYEDNQFKLSAAPAGCNSNCAQALYIPINWIRHGTDGTETLGQSSRRLSIVAGESAFIILFALAGSWIRNQKR